jgi:hypothetical protein
MGDFGRRRNDAAQQRAMKHTHAPKTGSRLQDRQTLHRACPALQPQPHCMSTKDRKAITTPQGSQAITTPAPGLPVRQA